MYIHPRRFPLKRDHFKRGHVSFPGCIIENSIDSRWIRPFLYSTGIFTVPFISFQSCSFGKTSEFSEISLICPDGFDHVHRGHLQPDWRLCPANRTHAGPPRPSLASDDGLWYLEDHLVPQFFWGDSGRPSRCSRIWGKGANLEAKNQALIQGIRVWLWFLD